MGDGAKPTTGEATGEAAGEAMGGAADAPGAGRARVWRREEPESPCVRVCVVHPQTGYCLGCGRTVEEIARWPRMTAEERRAVLAVLGEREAAPRGRRGGAAARRAGPRRRD